MHLIGLADCFIYMKQIINDDGLSFELESDSFTAKVIGSSGTKSDILIPRNINYQDNDYLITVIAKYSFKGNKIIKSVKFSDDSGILIIEKKAFFRSSIEKLYLPSSIEKLESGWCNSTPKLISISVSPQNHRILFYDNKYLVGKMNENDEDFDILLFARRNVGQEKVPSFIKQIDRYAFGNCKLINSIEFSENSKIETIKKSAFDGSSIQKVHIPSTVVKIEEGWCQGTKNLQSITISPKNKNFELFENKFLLGKSNQNIDKFDTLLFAHHSIKQATISSYIKRIGSYCFFECKTLQKIEFSQDSELVSIGNKSFVSTSIESIKIPDSVESIGKSAFFHCMKLKSVKITDNSRLSSIGKGAFKMAAIEKISIPQNVTKLDDYTFNSCDEFSSIEFLGDSHLQSIGGSAFSLTRIVNVVIPSSVVEIGKKSFSSCYNLKSVKFQKNSKLKVIGESAFSSSLLSIDIPPSIEEIHQYAFQKTFIESLEFDENSNLQTLDSFVFYQSSIQSMSMPSKVKVLKDGWCCQTLKLTNISVSPHNEHFKYINNQFLIGKSDEKSDKFDILFFARRDIKSAIIPSYIRIIGPFAFSGCKKLSKVEFDENSELVSIENDGFSDSSIESISLPSSVSHIGENAFSWCHNLQIIDNFENTQIKSIEKAFNWSHLTQLSIPSTVEELKDEWCSGMTELMHISVASNNRLFTYFNEKFLLGKSDKKSDIFDILYFCRHDIKKAVIPSFITKIGSYAFIGCFRCNCIEFPNDSQLISIDKKAFCACQFEKVIIPKSVTKISSSAFYSCNKLKAVEFNENSKLEVIDDCVFSDTLIESISIPMNVSVISDMTFARCSALCAIEFLGEKITFGYDCFYGSPQRSIISFPNAGKVSFLLRAFPKNSSGVSVFVSACVKIF